MVANLRRAMIGVQLLLLVLLIVGRTFGAAGDTQRAPNSLLSIAPNQALGFAR
jgi:hypothetical protein